MAFNGYFNIKFVCHKSKISTPAFPWGAATDLALTALFDAVQAISLATAEKSFLTQQIPKDTGTNDVPPGTASRGKKFLLKYRDTVTLKTHQIEVPGGNDGLLTTGSDLLPLGSGVGLDLKAAFDIAVVSPEGNPVSLYEIEFDTRNIE